MIIKALQEIIYECDNDLLAASKVRVSKVKDVMNNRLNILILFDALEECLNKKSLDCVSVIVRKGLFYEEVDSECIELLYHKYNQKKDKDDKENFIEELKQSFLVRGYKGYNFCWSYIINK